LNFYTKWFNSEDKEGKTLPWPCSKVVCVGRNYVAHAKELNNPIPKTPLLFIKSTNTLADLEQPIKLPQSSEQCHHELEVAIVVGKRLTNASYEEATAAVFGVGLGLDLTLRDLQSQLKNKGQPWEKAKNFDGACPLSGFIDFNGSLGLDKLEFAMKINGKVVQRGNTSNMIFPIISLLVDISRHFSLFPGDVVLTGTPEGVSALHPGDLLELSLNETILATTLVD
jgi:2-keto-4-pentenoate hydratase/2-oxohepta-3-ene-1,7-dioic acid hydratase in catechol pathway